jgi:NO-binding membrane sensor protein with MHYT domain
LHVIDCLTHQHDPRLIVLTALLCFFSSSTAMSMIARARISQGRMRAF